MGRGVRSHFTPVTPQLRQLSQQVSENPQLHTTFSNTLQRHISQTIVSHIYDNENNLNPMNTVDNPPIQYYPTLQAIPGEIPLYPPPPIFRHHGLNRAMNIDLTELITDNDN